MTSESVVLAGQLKDQRLLGEALMNRTVHHLAYMQFRELTEVGRRAEALLRASGDLWDLATTLSFLGFAYVYMGQLEEVPKIAEKLEPLAERLGHLGGQMIARRRRNDREFALSGDIGALEEAVRQDMEFCKSANLPWIAESHTWLGVTVFWAGRWDEAAENFREGAKLAVPGALKGLVTPFVALHTAYCGDKETAVKMLRQLAGDLPRPGQPNSYGAWTVLFATVEALTVLGELAEAAKLYPLVIESLETGTLARLFDYRLLPSIAGMAAAAGECWDKAEEHYRTALRQAYDIPIVTEQPEVRRFYARMLIDRNGPGDRDKAFRLLTEAIEIYRKIGMPKHVEMAEALLRRV